MLLVIAPPVGGLDTQRMVKVGDYSSGPNFSIKQVTGWAADSAAPATVTSSKLVVQGDGDAVITAVLDSQTDDDAKPGAVKLMHNSAVVATGDLSNYQNRRTITVTSRVTVAEGDTIWLQTQTGSAIAAQIYAGSSIQISPA